MNKNSRGATVLLPYLDALNWKGDESRLNQHLNRVDTDLNTDDIIDIMASLHYKYIPLNNVKKGGIDESHLPILLEDKGEYKIILKRDDKHALVYDSRAESFMHIPLDQLSGNCMTFKYVADLKDSLLHEQKNWFNKLIFRFGHSLKSLIGLTFMLTLLDLMIPLFVILIYDQIGSSKTTTGIGILFVGVLLYFAASSLFEFYRSNITTYVSVRMGNIIAKQTFKKLLYLPPTYTETASVSAQINRIKDFENLKRFTESGIFLNLLELAFGAIYVIAIFVLGGWLWIVPIVTLIVVLFVGVLLKPLHNSKLETTANKRGSQQHNLLEVLRNTNTIKASGMVDFWLRRSSTISAESAVASLEQSKFTCTSNNFIYFLTNVSVLVIIYGGVTRVFEGLMSMGALIGVMLLYWKVLRSIRLTTSLLIQMNGLKKSVQQINRFMKLTEDATIKPNMVLARDINGQVHFKDVSIRYNKASKAALININFNIEQGNIFAISGHDGAGKTTILKLILGMYIPQGGRILIDNWNIKQLEPVTLRQAVGYAPEKDLIFTGTIRSNFKHVNPSITDEEILSISEKTGLNKYMKTFQYTLDTDLSHQTLQNTSKTFLKLLSLTRCFSRDVALYLVDEPENYLDSDEILKITEVIKELSMQKKTVIISSKSDLMLDISDQILKMNQGRGKLIQKGIQNEKS